MLNANIDTLAENALTVELVHDNTNGMSGDVVDDTGLSVVHLVGHTLLDGTVTLEN